MREFLLMFLFTLIWIACSDEKEQVDEIKKSSIDFSRLAIVREYYPLQRAVEYTSLTKLEINKVLILLEEKIEKYNNDSEDYWRINLEKYRFQLVPIINKEGEKEVWVNSFCSEYSKISQNDLDWKNRAIIVFDGGKCYFNLKVNLKTSKAFDLGINGEA